MKNAEDFTLISSKKLNDNLKPYIDYRFKIIYTIGILSVIASHLVGKGSIELNIQGWFNYNTFHMPLFMFSAGYFFKNKNVNYAWIYIKKKFNKLIIPIYMYNFCYGLYNNLLKNFGFKNNISTFNFKILFISPLYGSGFRNISPAWFSSSLFFVEVYNIIKRKSLFLINIIPNESVYLLFDFFISFSSVNLSNKGYNKFTSYMRLLRCAHLNIYYELGLFYGKYLEQFFIKIRNDFYFVIIFFLKLMFHIYYGNSPSFYYGISEFYNYSPFTVIIISILGILFWMRISEILQPNFGKSFYVNIIADNTFSIMINHIFAIDLVKIIFAFLSIKTKYCKNFDFKRFYSFDISYIFLPNNVLQIGIIYFLSSIFIPILIQKFVNKIKKNIQFYFK